MSVHAAAYQTVAVSLLATAVGLVSSSHVLPNQHQSMLRDHDRYNENTVPWQLRLLLIVKPFVVSYATYKLFFNVSQSGIQLEAFLSAQDSIARMEGEHVYIALNPENQPRPQRKFKGSMELSSMTSVLKKLAA